MRRYLFCVHIGAEAVDVVVADLPSFSSACKWIRWKYPDASTIELELENGSFVNIEELERLINGESV